MTPDKGKDDLNGISSCVSQYVLIISMLNTEADPRVDLDSLIGEASMNSCCDAWRMSYSYDECGWLGTAATTSNKRSLLQRWNSSSHRL